MTAIGALRTSGLMNRVLLVTIALTWSAAAARAQTNVRQLHSFVAAEGTDTSAPLLQTHDGLFYGVNRYGGASDRGTIFRMTANGTVLVLHSFAGGPDDGSHPGSRLIEDGEGTLYGTTSEGGLYNGGVLFRMTPAGAITIVHSFGAADDTGRTPGGLVLTSAGELYGTACTGGAHDRGVVFRWDGVGPVTPAYAFTDGTDGRCPYGLLQAKDGNLYGIASGGPLANGLAFRLTTDGVFGAIHNFIKATDGGSPGPLVQSALDGHFYGAAYNGGSFGGGTAFRLTAGGTLTVLHAFGQAQTYGFAPVGPLVEGTDGQLYGATEYGGAQITYFSVTGTLFRLSRTGVYSTLRIFRGEPDGNNPRTGLMQGADGHIYGSATGGFSSGGIIFRLETYLCTNTIDATFFPEFGTLAMTFRFQSAAPGTWSVWAISSGGLVPLWSLPIGPVSVLSGFGTSFFDVAPAGPLALVTKLDVPGFGSCGGWAVVDTGTPASPGASRR